MYVLDSLTQELQILNVEQKKMVDDITDKTADLEKSVALLQITIDSKHTASNKNTVKQNN